MNRPDVCLKILKVECSIPTLARVWKFGTAYLSQILPPVSSENEKTWRTTKQKQKTTATKTAGL